MPTERLIWAVRPSLLNALPMAVLMMVVAAGLAFVMSLFQAPEMIVAAAVFTPLIVGMYNVVSIATTVFSLSDQQFRKEYGVFSRRVIPVELYRIHNYEPFFPFLFRIIGRGNLIVEMSDSRHSTMVIKGIKNTRMHKDILREYVEAARKNRGIIETTNR